MDPEPTRRERKRLQTRTAILEAARRLFHERGFDGTTVADVAEAADVAVATVFNHVAGKEELFFADRTPDAITYDPGTAPEERIGVSLVDALDRAAADYLGSLRDPVLLDMAAQIEAVPALSRYERTLYTHVESTIADRLRASGRVPHPTWTAVLLHATTRVLIHDHRADVIAGTPVEDALRDLRADLQVRLGWVLDATTDLPLHASPDDRTLAG